MPDQLFCKLNRNFMNYPIARDSRLRQHWAMETSTGRWLCRPGDNRDFYFSLPAGTKEEDRRCPTAFDVNVLLAIICKVQTEKASLIQFHSHAALLRDLGLSADTNNRQRLAAALRLWSCLTITFDRWYYHGEGMRDESERERGEGELVPPIELGNRGSGSICLAEAWRTINENGYTVTTPLPLPRHAPAQNLVLAALTAIPKKKIEGINFSGRSVRKLCRTIGLNHSTRTRQLREASQQATNWFEAQGGCYGTNYGANAGDKIFVFWWSPLIVGMKYKKKAEDARIAAAIKSQRDDLAKMGDDIDQYSEGNAHTTRSAKRRRSKRPHIEQVDGRKVFFDENGNEINRDEYNRLWRRIDAERTKCNTY